MAIKEVSTPRASTRASSRISQSRQKSTSYNFAFRHAPSVAKIFISRHVQYLKSTPAWVSLDVSSTSGRASPDLVSATLFVEEFSDDRITWFVISN